MNHFILDHSRLLIVSDFTLGTLSNALKLKSHYQEVRVVARSTSIPSKTLNGYHIKVKKNPDPVKPDRLTPNYAIHKIFTDDEERNSNDYIVMCNQMFYVLSIIDVRGLIFEVPMLNSIKVPDKYHETKLAGTEYLDNLRKSDNRVSANS